MQILWIYLIVVNVVEFILMQIDKRRAIKHLWRVPEKTFFLLALFGGALGGWCGMYAFRHKTKHWYFVLGMPVLTIVWIVLVILFRVNL